MISLPFPLGPISIFPSKEPWLGNCPLQQSCQFLILSQVGKGTFCFCLWVFAGGEGRWEAQNSSSQWVFIWIPMELEVSLASFWGRSMTWLRRYLCYVGRWFSFPADICFSVAVSASFWSMFVSPAPPSSGRLWSITCEGDRWRNQPAPVIFMLMTPLFFQSPGPFLI